MSTSSAVAGSTISANLAEFTGENFDSANRRCQGLMILSVEEAAGGALKWVSTDVLYALVRQRCNLPLTTTGNAIGRYFFALRNRFMAGVKRKGDRPKEYFYAVNQELVDQVRAGKFGELPFGMFVSQPDDVSLSGTVTMTPAEPSPPPTYEELLEQLEVNKADLAKANARVAALESTNEFLKGELEALEGGEIVLPKKG
jgi:hypothetical protein